MNQSTSSPRVFFTVIFLMGALQTAYARTSSGTITHSALAVIITCPSDITVSCASQVPSDESNFIVATSNCPGLVTVVLVGDVITNQICPDNYIITRTYQATDLCGNSATCIQIITVEDTDYPILICPPNVMLTCSASTAPANTGIATVIDGCTSNPVMFFTDMYIPGICTNSGVIQRTFTAMDDCGNSASCIQTITIDDPNPPVITCPANITITCTASTSPGTTGLATATDNCTLNPLISFVDTYYPGYCTNYAIIERIFTATDHCGNSATCIQNISIEDTIPPSITCPPNLTLSCSDNTAPVSTGFATATDNCTLNPLISYIDTYFPGPCPNNGVTQRIFTATDDCGNSATCIQIISVNDNYPATIIDGPPDISVAVPGPSPCSAYVSIAIPSTYDSCDQNVILINDYNSTADASDFYQEGTTQVIFTATDNCGNTSTHSFTITVTCTSPPANAMVIHNNGNIDIRGYTSLGEASAGAPRIKMKELPLATTAATHNSSVSVPHGLTASKILSVSVLTEWDEDLFVSPEYSSALNLRYSYTVTATNIVIQNNTPPGDCLICSKPVLITIIYKE
ncbi:MAG TPA: hypothetical protein VGK46_03090 [Saprospiraceae bacterium]